jgi:hypothetical protein
MLHLRRAVARDPVSTAGKACSSNGRVLWANHQPAVELAHPQASCAAAAGDRQLAGADDEGSGQGLNAGDRLGPHVILSPIAAGGICVGRTPTIVSDPFGQSTRLISRSPDTQH